MTALFCWFLSSLYICFPVSCWWASEEKCADVFLQNVQVDFLWRKICHALLLRLETWNWQSLQDEELQCCRISLLEIFLHSESQSDITNNRNDLKIIIIYIDKCENDCLGLKFTACKCHQTLKRGANLPAVEVSDRLLIFQLVFTTEHALCHIWFRTFFRKNGIRKINRIPRLNTDEMQHCAAADMRQKRERRRESLESWRAQSLYAWA